MLSFDMLKSTRRKIFYTLVGLFLVFGTGIVAYAGGWRLNFDRWRFEKVGQIYVRSFPQDAVITIDGKSAPNEAGFISRGTLIDNLLPRTHSLALAKPGYAPWHEDVAVMPSVVTALKYAVLVPQNATTVFMGPLAQAFPTKFGILTQDAHGMLSLNSVPLIRGTIAAQDDRSAASSLHILIRSSATGRYYSEDVSVPRTDDLTDLFSINGIDLKNASRVASDAYAPLVVAMNAKTAWILDENSKTIVSATHASSGVAFISPPALAPSLILWAGFVKSHDASLLYRYDPGTGAAVRSSSTIPGQTLKIVWLGASDFAVLQDTGDLYTYNADTEGLKNLASDVLDVSISHDGTMLAARERSSIEVFSLNGTDYWRLNLPDNGNIRDLIWYRDDRHLFVAYPDRVAFLDLVDASLANVTVVGAGILPRYDAGANALYMLDSARNLIRFDFPG